MAQTAAIPALAIVPAFDPTRFRHVIGHFMSGVAVITTHHAGRDYGMTASAVSSLSLEPPMLTVCLHRQAPTQDAVLAAGSFAVNVLREGQDALATRFATPHAEKFEGVTVRRGELGSPLLQDALATIECAVQEAVVGGTHRIFLGAVRTANVGTGAPLAYYRGRFGRLEIGADEQALERVRRAILARQVPISERLDPERLAEPLEVPASSVEFALAQLLSERLVQRDPDGYRQVPLTAERSDTAFEAKLVIDLGAVRLGAERASDEALERIEQLARATAPSPTDVTGEEIDRLVAANEEFHEAVIGLAGNDALIAAYRRLAFTTIISHVLWQDHAAAAVLAEEHVQIARALRARELKLAESLIRAHNLDGRDSHRRAIVAAGGRI